MCGKRDDIPETITDEQWAALDLIARLGLPASPATNERRRASNAQYEKRHLS